MNKNFEEQAKLHMAIVVGHIVGEKYGEQFKEWAYDMELTNLAREVYEEFKDSKYTRKEIVEFVDKFMEEI
jgi:hypothetical protein